MMRTTAFTVVLLVVGSSATAETAAGPKDVPMDAARQKSYNDELSHYRRLLDEAAKREGFPTPPAWELMADAAVQCRHEQYSTALTSYKGAIEQLVGTGADGATGKNLKVLHDPLFATLELRYPGYAEATLREAASIPSAKGSAAARFFDERPTGTSETKSANGAVAVMSRQLALATKGAQGEHEIQCYAANSRLIGVTITCRSSEWVYRLEGQNIKLVMECDGATIAIPCSEYLKQMSDAKGNLCVEQLVFRLPPQVADMVVASDGDVPVRLGRTEFRMGVTHRVAIREVRKVTVHEPYHTASAN